MRRPAAFLIILPAVAAITSCSPAAAQVTGRAYVTDGDTIRVGRDRVRLHGIQAPELGTGEGARSRAALVQLIGNRTVECRDTGERSYARIVAVCSVNGADLAEAMVSQGWAFDWRRFSGGRYASAEASARRAGRGLHSD